MIRRLPKELQRHGFNYRCVEADDHGYIYLVEANGHIFYEVFEIRISQICLDFKRRIYSEDDRKHRYPRDKDFGVWAWTYPKLDKALVKLNSIRSMNHQLV